MSTHLNRISLGHVNFSNLNTDADVRREAKRVLPKALRQIGEAMGEEAWDAMQKGLKGPGIKMNRSASDRRKFIQEAGRNYERQLSANEKKKIEDHIFEQLRNQKQGT